MKAFMDDHRDADGVEPIGKGLPIAPSTDALPADRRADPRRRSARAPRDEFPGNPIRRVWDENFQVDGARKVGRQLLREGGRVARCTVERLIRQNGLPGGGRGQPVKTTVSDRATPCPLDRVNRPFRADRPNAPGVSDFTEVSPGQGFVQVAFGIDGVARCRVGGKGSNSARTDFVRDALEPARAARPPVSGDRRIHPGDRGVQYGSIRSTERLAEAGIEPSVGRVGDSCDHALAETINGLYKAKVIHRQSWKNREAVELATLTWVDGFNPQRLLAPIGNVPPAEAEEGYYRQLNEFAMAA